MKLICRQYFNLLLFLFPSWHDSLDSYGEYLWVNPYTKVWSNIHTDSYKSQFYIFNIFLWYDSYHGIKQKRPPQTIHCKMLNVSSVWVVTCMLYIKLFKFMCCSSGSFSPHSDSLSRQCWLEVLQTWHGPTELPEVGWQPRPWAVGHRWHTLAQLQHREIKSCHHFSSLWTI